MKKFKKKFNFKLIFFLMFLYYFDVIKSVKLAELGDAKKEKMTAIGEREGEREALNFAGVIGFIRNMI